jgi:DNA-directed RNA polymerase subunit alpha
MAILSFQKPEKVIMIESTDSYGKFEFRPLEPGYGITVGNALRRVLLNSLEGYAITSIKIEGVDHEFATIPGVIDDVTNIILNLKQVRFKNIVEKTTTETVKIKVSGVDTFTAGQIGEALSGFEVLNPDLVICRMEPTVKLNIELTVNKGRGWTPAEENRDPNAVIGTIPVDAIYTPIVNVKYAYDNYRVGQKTDYEKLTMEIETDGSIRPEDALKEAANILIYHFLLFSDEKMVAEIQNERSDEFNEEILHMRQLLKTRLFDMDLSVRAMNCLKSADLETLGQLVALHKSELLKFRNFGKKSLTELEEKLKSLNLNFGMDISKYKIDKE